MMNDDDDNNDDDDDDGDDGKGHCCTAGGGRWWCSWQPGVTAGGDNACHGEEDEDKVELKDDDVLIIIDASCLEFALTVRGKI